MNTESIDLSVLVPVYNGESFIERTLTEVIDFVASRDEPAELIVVDDGSTDRTGEILERVAAGSPASVQVIRSPNNEGKGAAVKRAMAVAKGAYRVFLDADLAYSPQAITEVRSQLAAGADVVIGSRVHPESTYQVKPPFFRYLYTRHVAGRVFNWIVRLLLLPGIYDSQAGLKGFTARAADIIFGGWLPDRFSFDLGVLSRARYEHLSIEQIPVQYRYDSEPTTVRFMSDTASALFDLAVVRLRIGGEYSRKGFGRLIDWAGRHLDRLRRSTRSRSATVVGIAIVILGLITHALSRTAISSNWLASVGWLVALAGLLLVARRDDSKMPQENRPLFETVSEMSVFLLILGLAAVLRLWNLSEIPPDIHGDSAECGIQGLHIALGKVDDIFGFSPWYYTPYPAHLPYAATFKLFGTSLLGLRVPSAIAGILSVIPLYFLVRGWLGRRAAQIAATLFALSHASIHFSRIGLWNIQALFLLLVAFAFFLAALRTGRSVFAAFAGISTGLGFYTYTGGRLIFVVIAAAFALQCMFGPRRRLIKVAAFGAAGMAVALVPLAVSYAKSPDILRADRTGSVLVLAGFNRDHVVSVTGQTSTAGILRVQTIRSIRGFTDLEDRSGQYATIQPLASPTTAALGFIGVLLAAARWRETESRLVLLWFGFGLVLGSILIIDPPSHTRLIMLFPVPFIFAALALETSFAWLDRRGGQWRHLLIAVAAVLTIGQAVVFNLRGYYLYIDQISRQARVWDVVRIVEEYGGEHDYYFFGGPTMLADAPGLRLLAHDRRIVSGVTPTDIPQKLNRDTVFVIAAELLYLEPQMERVGTVITDRFPNAQRRNVGEDDEAQFHLYIAAADQMPPGSGGSRDPESR
jgi:glycosyltransferase involved in cell wall biosynthesis/4-amino-4-deoxy-L-arabinose transferase-like glycosyltransferase